MNSAGTDRWSLRRGLPARAALGRGLFLIALSGAVAGCRTQRWLEPMEPTVWPLPPGAGSDYVPGLEEVVAIRHSDPVAVRRAGEDLPFSLNAVNRRERLNSGGWVMTRAGGHAEVFWPLSGTSILFHEEGALWVGEQARDEPAATFEVLSFASVKLSPGVRIALPTGAELSGDEARESGPFKLEARFPEILRVSNDSKVTAFLAYRREVLPLGPGQSVDLALLEAGTRPEDAPPDVRRALEGGVAVDLEGEVEVREFGAGLVAESTGAGRARALGVSVELDPDRRALFLPLGADLPAGGPLPEPRNGAEATPGD